MKNNKHIIKTGNEKYHQECHKNLSHLKSGVLMQQMKNSFPEK